MDGRLVGSKRLHDIADEGIMFVDGRLVADGKGNQEGDRKNARNGIET